MLLSGSWINFGLYELFWLSNPIVETFKFFMDCFVMLLLYPMVINYGGNWLGDLSSDKNPHEEAS